MRPTPTTVRRLALASVFANALIVVTGGAVRLTGSGLGCPTWPRCTDDTLTPTRQYAAHGLIEFGNRMLTFVLTAVVVAVLVAALRARPRRPDLVRLAAVGVLGVPAQALLGGVTVLTGLNPWTVMLHFLLSMLLLAVAVVLHRRAGEGDRPLRPSVPPALRALAFGLLVLTGAVLAVGTVVTGSGPHSGDPTAGRTGLPPARGQSAARRPGVPAGRRDRRACGRPTRAAGAGGPARATAVLLGVELAQGAVGFVQYFTGLPVALVAAHLLGACLVLVAAVRVVLATRDRGPLVLPPSAPATLVVPAREGASVAV